MWLPSLLLTAALPCLSLSLVGQWMNEAKNKLAGDSLKVYQYHGSNRIRDPVKLAQYDLVRCQGGAPSPLFTQLVLLPVLALGPVSWRWGLAGGTPPRPADP